MRFKKVKDHLRAAHDHHTNTAGKTEINGQIMTEITDADDDFKPPVGRKGEVENRKNILSRCRVNLGWLQREKLL